MLQQLALGYAATWALVLARVSGFVIGSPFPGAHVSNTQRVALVVTLAWIATSFAPTAGVPHDLDSRLGLLAASELGCGLVIGLAFRFVLVASDVLGQVLSHAIGLSSASVLNPTIGQVDTVLTRIVTLIALLLALTAGVHRIALGALLASFRALPLGSPMSFQATTATFIEMTIESFAVGVRLAMPVMAVALVVNLGLAMIARVAPAIQIFSVGFAVLLATGTLVLLSSLRDVGSGLLLHFSSLSRFIDTLLIGLSGQTP
jgi:flagellar biosynthesis protein FliR